MLAELTFGFWSQLTSASREKALWLPYLHHAYPPGTRRKDIDTAIRRVNELRNRIAHHEPVFNQIDTSRDLASIHEGLESVLGMLSPQVLDHLQARSTFNQVLDNKPV